MKFSLIIFSFLIVLIHSCYGFTIANTTDFTGTIENSNGSLELQYGDLLKCKVYEIVRGTEYNHTRAGLPMIQANSSDPIYFPLSLNQTCFSFSVKKRPAPIQIYLADNNGTLLYKAVLGKLNATDNQSFLYDEYGNVLVKMTHFKNKFNESSFDKIWIRVSNIDVGVEIGLNEGTLIKRNYTSDKRITQIGIISIADRVEYIIHHEPTCNTYSLPSRSIDTAKIFCEEFKYNKDNSTNNATEQNMILIQKDLFQQIYSDGLTFNKTVEGTGNSTNNLYARRHLSELDSLFSQAKSNHYQIMHSNDNKLVGEYMKNYLYVQIKWQYFNYLKSVLENIKN